MLVNKNRVFPYCISRVFAFTAAVILPFMLLAGCSSAKQAESTSAGSGITTGATDATDTQTSETQMTDTSNSAEENLADPTTADSAVSNSASASKTSDGEETTATTTDAATTTQRTPSNSNGGIRVVCGSFIQPWLVVNWTQARWDQECTLMAQAGMKYIILQSIVDFTYNTDNNNGQDPDSYSLTQAISLYPSSIDSLQGANNGVDALERCLKACEKTGMQAIIGPVSDNRWWLYGWGLPKMPSGSTDRVTQSYMAEWVVENASVSNQIASEIMDKYGSEYGNQIYAWYYNNEVWNISAACEKTDNGVYAQIIANSLNLSLNHYSSIAPGMPLMLSPFINPTLSTESQCGSMWEDIFSLTNFRSGDIFAPQDSYGNNNDIDLSCWYSEYKEAVDTKSGLVLWANNENFRTNGATATIGDFITKQVNVTAQYAAANICFSWNHYYSPVLCNSGYNASYLQYITSGELDCNAPSKPILSEDGSDVVVSSSDDIGICGVRVYKGNTTALYSTSVCGNSAGDDSFLTISLDPGTYYISTYDFSGNESELTSLTIS